MYTTIAVLLGIIADFIFADPYVDFHPICLIGKLISLCERFAGKIFDVADCNKEDDSGRKKRLLIAGAMMWFAVIIVTVMVSGGLLLIAWKISKWLYVAVAALESYFVMSTKTLKRESMKVFNALKCGDIDGARFAVSMIVGRDTDSLDMTGIAKAAVETVAENTSDGSIAPLFYMAIGGPALGFLYKAVNTMDSMVGYKNEKYLFFGRFAARMDDVFNYIPARIAAYIMIFAAKICGMDMKNACRIYRRDAKKSTSPNAGQTEAVCAGALHVQLIGDTVYFGKIHHKPAIGDNDREIEFEDIRRVNMLMYATVIIMALLVIAVRMVYLM